MSKNALKCFCIYVMLIIGKHAQYPEHYIKFIEDFSLTMPSTAVKTIKDLIFWQYAKIIAESAHFGKTNYGFIMSKFEELQTGKIQWSTSIREYIKEHESPDQCIYCGAVVKLTLEHILPQSRGGEDIPDNIVWYADPAIPAKEAKGYMNGKNLK